MSAFYGYILSKNKKESELNNLLEITREFSKSLNPTGTDKDEMPEGYGEFGLETTNPIPMRSIPDSYFYLNRLKTSNGSEITYERIGCLQAPNIEQAVDAYNIYSNGQQIAKIYICAYNKKNSTKTPKGFKLV